MACNLYDLTRIPSEDRTFNASIYPETREQVICVEVDHVNKRLYTLTSRALYRQSIVVASAPGTDVVFDLFAPPQLLQYYPDATPFPKLEDVRDLRVWATAVGGGKLLVLTSKRILIFRDDGSALSLLGQTTELDPADTASEFSAPSCEAPYPNQFSTRQVAFFHKFRLMQDANGKVMA